jgi:hypothetical protein
LHIRQNNGKVDRKDYLYFPADERHVFVLDIADEARNKPCVDMLEVGHPAGSLRSEPTLLSREDQRLIDGLRPEDWPDLLLLYQADGLNAMKVRVFQVATPGQFGVAGAALREPVVEGWSSFPPYHDGERLVQVTDAGRLGVVGIRQLNNQDRDLFEECIQSLFKGNLQPGRAQIVHVAEDDFWVLADGKLQLWHLDRFNKQASRIAPVWPQPLSLGSPLHASQVNFARKTAFLVTQDTKKPTCWISAVDVSIDTPSANLRRKVQLGLLCHGDPIFLGKDVLVLDEGGGLFQFDPSTVKADQEWQEASCKLVTPSAGVVGPQQFLLPSRDAKSLFAVAKSSAKQLVVGQYEPGASHAPRVYNEFSSDLTGTPGVGDDCLVVAGTDGNLWYLSLKEARRIAGPEWRSRYSGPAAQGFVVHLGGDEFLATNGARGLTRWRWDGTPKYELMTPKSARAELISGKDQDIVAGQIVAPPIVLPRAMPTDPLQVMVGDSRGIVTLLHEEEKANERRWKAAASWDLKGHITAGPFLRGDHVGCVVDHDRLIWIDPADKDKPREYSAVGEGIVGQPQIVEGLLLVAHRTGRFVGVDLATFKPLTKGYELKARTAPAATPVAFGEGRAFAPLTDGTVMLLSLKHLRPQVAAGAK